MSTLRVKKLIASLQPAWFRQPARAIAISEPRLPEELFSEIAQHLSAHDIAALSLVVSQTCLLSFTTPSHDC